jgi:hypothetical protein
LPALKKEHQTMIKQYVNPYRQIYLWGSQEALDLKALLDCISQIDQLEEKRKKLMNKLNWT